MELIEIEAFLAIAEHGTFTSAAEHLHISQPAISRRIDVLEHELGYALFERTRRGALTTSAGRAFLPFAQQAIAAVRDGARAVAALESPMHGTISLAIVGTLASTTLLDRIRAFRSGHPGVRVLLQTANSNQVSEKVRSGQVDIGLRYYADPSPGLVSLPVASEQLCIACSAQSSLVTPGRTRAQDLAGIPWISFPVGSGSSGEPFARALETLLGRLGLTDAERIHIDSLTAQKRMIEADFGVGLVPESALTEETRLGTLRILETGVAIDPAPIALVRRTGSYEDGALRALIAQLGAT